MEINYGGVDTCLFQCKHCKNIVGVKADVRWDYRGDVLRAIDRKAKCCGEPDYRNLRNIDEVLAEL